MHDLLLKKAVTDVLPLAKIHCVLDRGRFGWCSEHV